MPFRLLLPRKLYEAMLAQARAELPNECCGVLSGRREDNGRTGRIVRLHPLVNACASPREYLSEPRSMFEAVREMRRLELDLLATYHSHPTSDPIPSRTDLARNYDEQVANFIISLRQETPAVRAWWLTPESYTEADWELVP